MDGEPAYHDDCLLGDEVALVLVVLGDHVHHAGFSDWSVAHDFFDDGADVGEIMFVIPGWGAVWADDAVEFFLCFGDYFGVQRELEH